MRNLYKQTKNKSLIAIVYFFSFYKQTKDYFEILSLSLCSLSLSLQQITPNHKIKHDAYKYDLSPSDNVISSLKDVIMM